MITSQVIQVTWLIGQLIKTDNLHVSRNLSILIVVMLYIFRIGTRDEIDKLLGRPVD